MTEDDSTKLGNTCPDAVRIASEVFKAAADLDWTPDRLYLSGPLKDQPYLSGDKIRHNLSKCISEHGGALRMEFSDPVRSEYKEDRFKGPVTVYRAEISLEPTIVSPKDGSEYRYGRFWGVGDDTGDNYLRLAQGQAIRVWGTSTHLVPERSLEEEEEAVHNMVEAPVIKYTPPSPKTKDAVLSAATRSLGQDKPAATPVPKTPQAQAPKVPAAAPAPQVPKAQPRPPQGATPAPGPITDNTSEYTLPMKKAVTNRVNQFMEAYTSLEDGDPGKEKAKTAYEEALAASEAIGSNVEASKFLDTHRVR